MIGLIVLALLAVLSPVVVWAYLGRLPVAPSCPRCRELTLEGHERAAWSTLALLAPVSWRQCTHCGWRGRMRWRWARSPVEDES